MTDVWNEIRRLNAVKFEEREEDECLWPQAAAALARAEGMRRKYERGDAYADKLKTMLIALEEEGDTPIFDQLRREMPLPSRIANGPDSDTAETSRPG